MVLRRLLPFVIAALASFAWAFEPVVGTEVVLTDSSGERLLGYGLIGEDALVLDLAAESGRFLMLVVGPDGSFEALAGSLDPDGRFHIVGDDGVERDLRALLAESGFSLDLRSVSATVLNLDDSDGEDHAGPGGGDDEEDDEDEEDNSGPGGGDEEDPEDEEDEEDPEDEEDDEDEDEEDNSGSGGGDDEDEEDEEDEEDNSGSGGGDDEDEEDEPDEDDNSGPGGGGDEDEEDEPDEDDNSGSGGGDEDDDES